MIEGGEAETADVAVVVPALDDTAAVHRLFEQIAAWRPRPCEVVVVSGAADRELEALCARHGHRYLESPPCRGTQLDCGARATRAGALWFLHADASPPRDGLRAVTGAVAAGAAGGCFGFAFQGPPAARKRLIAAATRLRVRCGGIPYGDQALFARREDYFSAGGFAPAPLFEEVPLVRGLRRRGRFIVLPQRVAVATRRWDRDGWWRRALHNRWLALRYACGTPAERLARAYTAVGPPA